MSLFINCDMGESFSLYKCGDDEGIMPFVDVANVACGFHASDPVVMKSTVLLAKINNVKVGAHPSFPDLQGFGRREMNMGRDELSACIIYQVAALKGFLDAEGMQLSHIKPHGALYGAAIRHEHVAHAIADAATIFNVPVMGMAGTLQEKIYTERGLVFWAEFYADLEYNDDGGLIATRVHKAVDSQRAAAECLRVIRDGQATTQSGKLIPMKADCVCVHSDTPGAVELAKVIHEAIRKTDVAAHASAE